MDRRILLVILLRIVETVIPILFGSVLLSGICLSVFRWPLRIGSRITCQLHSIKWIVSFKVWVRVFRAVNSLLTFDIRLWKSRLSQFNSKLVIMLMPFQEFCNIVVIRKCQHRQLLVVIILMWNVVHNLTGLLLRLQHSLSNRLCVPLWKMLHRFIKLFHTFRLLHLLVFHIRLLQVVRQVVNHNLYYRFTCNMPVPPPSIFPLHILPLKVCLKQGDIKIRVL